jgi:hypothetical protein
MEIMRRTSSARASSNQEPRGPRTTIGFTARDHPVVEFENSGDSICNFTDGSLFHLVYP